MSRRKEFRWMVGLLAGMGLVVFAVTVPEWVAGRIARSRAIATVSLSRPDVLGDERYVRGPRGSRFALVEFGDFACESCSEAAPIVDTALRTHPGELRLVFRHFPLRTHPTAAAAAHAAESAGEQGRFWEMHDQLFLKPGEKDDEALQLAAGEAGLDISRAMRQFGSPEVARRVEADAQAGRRLGVTITPTFFFVTPTRTVRIIGPEFLGSYLEDRANWR